MKKKKPNGRTAGQPQSPPTRPKITLAMITKNEANVLRDCLDSVQGVADEIVIADTGSDDDTVSIANEYGAKVVEFPWTDDFSVARNYALSHATGDWLLILDADEQLDPDTKQSIRETVEKPDADFCYLRLQNMTDGKPVGGEVRTLRLFRNLEGFRYHGRIHEQPLLVRVKPGVWCDALIQHYGYAPAVFEAKKKKERNVRLLEKGLADTEDGANPKLRSMYLYYYSLQASGEEYFGRLQNFAKFVRAEYDKIRGRLPWLPCGMVYYATELRNRDLYEELRATVDWTLEHYGEAPILHSLLAHALVRSGEFDRAEQELDEALSPEAKLDPIHHEYSLPTGLASMIGRVVLAELRERQGRWPDAEQVYRTLLTELPGVHPRFAYVKVKQGDYQHALQVLEAEGTPIDQVRPEQACLAFILSLIVQSTEGLLRWGEKVRVAGDSNAVCGRVLKRVEGWELGRPFVPDDFPELSEILRFPAAEPRMQQAS